MAGRRTLGIVKPDAVERNLIGKIYSRFEKAGLQMKDVILEIDGKKVDLDNPLHLLINSYQPGDKIKLKVWRSGEIKEMTVQLTESE